MKKYFAIALLLATQLSTAVAGPDITRKTLDLPEFHSVYVNSNYTVYIKQSNKQEVTVEALSEIYEISEFKVEDGILHINIKRQAEETNKSLWSKIEDIKIAPTLKVMISMKSINNLKVNGNGKIISENSLAANNLGIDVSGSGSIDLDVKGDYITTNISGAGDITLKGYATKNDIKISGSGSLKAFACELMTAQVVVTGSGQCEIFVNEDLTATVYGSGSVKHKGKTEKVSSKAFGTGEIARAY